MKHKDLIAEYRFEGNANDTSGNGHHGTWSGTEAYAGGAVGQCASFDGASAVRVPYSASLNAGDTLTVSLWAFFPSPLTLTFELLVCRRVGTNAQWSVVKGNNEVFRANGASTAAISFSDIIQVGEWVHVCVTFEGTTARLYANGTEDSGGAITITAATDGTSDLLIGARGVDAESVAVQLTGLIDEVRIYNTALTPGDIKRVMMGLQPIQS